MPIGTKGNGLDGFDTELKFNSPLHVKHLETLVELQKDKTYDYSGRLSASEGRFSSGECPIFLTSSGYYATARNSAKFDFVSVPMPYYPDVAGAPQNSIIGGASLWVMGGKKPEEYKGVAKFFTFLSDTDRQAKLHQESGYLPITKAAYAKTKADGFYEKNPILETPLKELTNKEPTENSRGLRFGNMVQMRDIWSEEIEAALGGKKSAKEALDAAVSRGNQVLRQFERTVSPLGDIEPALIHRQGRFRHSGPDPAGMEKSTTFNGRLLPYLLLAPQLAITFIFFYWPATRRCINRSCARTRSDCRRSSSVWKTTRRCSRSPNTTTRSSRPWCSPRSSRRSR